MPFSRPRPDRTARELSANMQRAGLDHASAAEALGFSMLRLQRTLTLGAAADPVDVWLLRDLLDRTIRERAGAPGTWTVLTDEARERAARWFALRGTAALAC